MANNLYDVEGNRVDVGATDRTIDYHDIVFTMGYIYVRNVNGSGLLMLSVDGGETWTKSINVANVGLIKTYYVFKDLTLNIFTHTKAYYSTDWVTLNECTVLEQDGTPYVPTSQDNFSVTKTYERSIIDGNEMYVFGNYINTNESSNRNLIWYTVDNGHTYKIAYEFNITGAKQIRHVHSVHWCEDDGTFWVLTGDSASESYVFKGAYNSATDTWTWSDVGHGLNYKWASVVFYDGYFYYNNDITPGYVRRGKLGDEDDTSKHETILSNLPNDCIGLYLGKSGDMLVTLSSYRSGTSPSPNTAEEDCRNMYYSTDRVNFVMVKGTTLPTFNYADTVYYLYYTPNAQGKVLAALRSVSHEPLADTTRVPSVFLDEMLADAGFPFAFL